ncbi:unnamed protein product [Ixodes pacificus]
MLDPVHHLGLRLATGAFRTSPVLSLYVDTHQMSLEKRRHHFCRFTKCPISSRVSTKNVLTQHRYGHSAQSCRGKTTCAKCGKNDHPAENCSNPPCCINCGEPHPAYSRSCRKWKQEKEIITLKVKENISFPEARKRFSFLQKGPYSLVARAGGVPSKSSVGTQVYASVLMEGLQEERRQHQPQGQGTGASSIPNNGPSTDVPALVTRTPPKKKEGVFPFKALGEASTSKEVPVPAAPSAVQPEEERMELGEPPPSPKSLVFQLWQSEWSLECENKLHSIKPALGMWESASRKIRRHEVLLCRLRIGHSYLTHKHLLRGKPHPCVMTVGSV